MDQRLVKSTEEDEKEYLRYVYHKLGAEWEKIEKQIKTCHDQIIAAKKYMYENRSSMDTAEKALNRVVVFDQVSFGEEAQHRKNKIERLRKSPYFGRIDFRDKNGIHTFYIAVNGFSADEDEKLMYDWRAPVSSMFYDYEKGQAAYQAPDGQIEGEILLKRQYKTIQDHLEYMVETDLNIGDEILQKELSMTSDQKMKNIVATIQREQNAVIRNENTNVMIIQGAAGSGKTSIALHRIAFLMYRNKGRLSAEDILILSPNRVFSDYISGVLPELGEENIQEEQMDHLFEPYLGKYSYQTFAEQVEMLINKKDQDAADRIRFKSTNSFVRELQDFLEYAEEAFFRPKTVKIGSFIVSRDLLYAMYREMDRYPIKLRLEKIAEKVISRYKMTKKGRISAAAARKIRESFLGLFQVKDAVSLYKEFFDYIGKPELFVMAEKDKMEYCDIYPYIYVKMYLEGTKGEYTGTKHLIIDEMQDYSPIQYAVLTKSFSCNMTILGDEYQSVNPYSSVSMEKIRPYFHNPGVIELYKSYRSTYEIAQFAKNILDNPKMIPIERHGLQPRVLKCRDREDEMLCLAEMIREEASEQYQTIGIICKSQEQAGKLYVEMKQHLPQLELLNNESKSFQKGVIVTHVHMSKGLEFDWAIVPDVSEEQYSDEMDRSLLYISCTRAMHRLDVLYYGEKSRLVSEKGSIQKIV